MRSAYAPEISAGEITANMHWYANHASTGTLTSALTALVSTFVMPAKSSPPITPCQLGPNASE